MGNCLTSHRVSSQDLELTHPPSRNIKEAQAEKVEQTKSSSFTLPEQLGSAKPRANKVVSFELHEGDDTRCKRSDGHVRIRMVVTRQELKQILDLKNKSHPSSLEQLLRVVKLRGIRRVSEGRDHDMAISTPWKPALESIPENS